MFQTTSNHLLFLSVLAIYSSALVSCFPVGGSVGIVPSSTLSLDTRQSIPDSLAKFPSGPLNLFLKMISSLPEGEKALDAVGKVLTPLQQGLAAAAGIDTTRDDVAKAAPCADMTVIFARGTTEPGNIGLVTGPPFLDALKEQLGARTLASQGVEYPATFAGFNRNGTDGVPSMTDLISQTIARCPASKIVMSGYSQGALVVRGTASSLPTDTMSKVNSVVTFGDPKNQTAITGADGKRLTVCRPDDTVCGGGFINIEHLAYGEDATKAAQFVLQEAGFE